MTDKLRAALDKTTPGFAYGDTPANEVLDYVRNAILPGINVTVRGKAVGKQKISVGLKQPIPAGAVLQYLEDELSVVFVLRDYGIVVVAADERLPPGAIRVGDFWKQGKTKAPASDKEPVDPKKAKFPNPPPKEIKGVIEKIDALDRSLVSLSVGSDDGLEAGHTVDVYRLEPQPKFLGTLQIVNVTARTAVGQVVGGAAPSLRVGDLVARQLTPDDATRRE
jgi:hypothetical protein